jgi:F-type H+-transporting ATPase subunit delta
MIEKTLVRIYAEALFQLAEERSEVEQVYGELRDLERLYDASKELSAFLCSPQVDQAEKKRLIERTLKPHLSPLTFHFLLTVVEKNREVLIPYMAEEFKEILDRINRRIDVDIRTAVSLPDDIVARLVGTLSRLLGKEVIPHVETDPNILGGFIVRVEDRILDASLLGKLEGLRVQLLENGRRRTAVNEDTA